MCADTLKLPSLADLPIIGPTASGKATDAEVIGRRRYVEALMERGSGAEVAARALADACDLSIVHARRYVTEVRNEWAALEDAERPSRRAALLRLLETNAERALAVGEFSAVNGAVREMARITGLDAKTITVAGMTGEQQAIIDSLHLTPQQRRAKLAKPPPDDE